MLYFYFQNSAAVLSIVSLLHDAKVHCDRFPSIAIDTGTEERSTIHLLTRMLNSMCSSCEYSGTQAVALALNLPAQFTMHKKVFLFSDQAIEYVRDTVLRINNPDLQNTDQRSETSSFSSGIYSNSRRIKFDRTCRRMGSATRL